MVEIRGKSDDCLQAVAMALAKFEGQHPEAQIVVYRQNPASIRVRVVDHDFENVTRADRHDTVWGLLEDLPEDIQSQISVLLAITPKETSMSFANYEFDHPAPSAL